MKKHLLSVIFLLAAGMCAFAGDVAAFVDLGISSDGKTYMFSEYGKTDRQFQGYAEIYTVDIDKNDFIDGMVFKTEPSALTVTKSGRIVYEELLAKVGWALKKYDCKSVDPDHVLFIRQEGKEKNTGIVFKDFEASSSDKSYFYNIDMVKNVKGSGKNLSSSFFITLEKKDENGVLISRNVVGNPGINRKGVSNYEINRIFTDKTGKKLVFVIEKTIEDESGNSIRYMVETVKL